MNKHKDYVEVRILNPGEQAGSIQAHFDTWFKPDGDDLVFRSAISPELPPSEHLKWFHGILQFDRRFVKQMEEAGIRTIIKIVVKERSFCIEPEAVLLAQQLHLKTEIEFRL